MRHASEDSGLGYLQRDHDALGRTGFSVFPVNEDQVKCHICLSGVRRHFRENGNLAFRE